MWAAAGKTEHDDRRQWNHTSAVICAIVNANPFRKGRAAKPDEFNPYSDSGAGPAKQQHRITADNIGMLKRFLPADKRKPKETP